MVNTTAFGADQAPDVGNAGGIQSLKDLGDYTKTANPSDTAGLSVNLASIGTKFKDMGAGSITDASKASSFFNGIQKVDTPLTNAAHPTLTDLINSSTSQLSSMIGSGAGPGGLPTIRDFIHPISGGSAYNDIKNNNINVDSIASLDSAINNSNDLISKAGIDTASLPGQSLTTSMNFASSLHKWGKDQSTGGISEILNSMANTSNKYGESIKASLAEGKNNDLLSANGIGPLKTNPFEGLPAYAGEDSSLATNAGAKLLGGGGGPPPTPSRGSAVGYSTDSGAFGSESTKGQVGTGTAGLKGTPFDITGGR